MAKITRIASSLETTMVSDISTRCSLQERCRICLKEGFIPIFGEEDKSIKVSEFGGIELNYFDNFPQHLCGSCYTLLEGAILFRKSAKMSDFILKNNNVKYSPYMSESYNKTYSLSNAADKSILTKQQYCESLGTSESDWNYDNEKYDNIMQSADTQDIEANNDMLILEQDSPNDDLVMIIVSGQDKSTDNDFNCGKCKHSFEDQEELVKHNIEVHLNETTKTDCIICTESVGVNDYEEHIKHHRKKCDRKNNKNTKIECKVCQKIVNKSYYKFHMKMHVTDTEKAGQFMTCTICFKSFSSNYLNEHIRRVHNTNYKRKRKQNEKVIFDEKNMLKCPVCDIMVDKTIFKRHLAKHRGPTKQYVCDKCGKVFKYPSAFKTHTLTHGTELKYKCQFCPYRGLHLGLLKIHVRTHTGDYNYKCTECPARFITKSNLSKHLQRHQGVCNFKCDTCQKGFYSKRDVDKHIKIVHLGLKNNICDICNKGFGHRDSLLSHQLKVHKRGKIIEKKGRRPNYLQEQLKLK